MKQKMEFMLVFRFEPNFSYQPTEAELQEMQHQWGTFIGTIAIQEKLISTHQLSFLGKQIFADHSIKEGIHISDQQTLGGTMVINATTMEEAVEIAQHCPILSMGGSVEVRAIQPM